MSERMRLVWSERERRLEQDAIRRRAVGRRVALVSCQQLRELTREEFQIPRSGSRRSAFGDLILERVEPRSEEPATRKLIAREDIAARVVARGPGVLKVRARRSAG